VKAVFRKEMADYFTSARVLILFALAIATSMLTMLSIGYIRFSGSTEFVFLQLFTAQADELPSFLLFLNFTALFFIPIMGIALGFDVINREQSEGTLSRILSQPVYRDSVINGKFLAGVCTLTIMVVTSVMLISGLGLAFRFIAGPIINTLNPVFGLELYVPVAVPGPIPEEVFRLFLFVVFAVVYGSFWMGLAILFSVLARRVASSLLASVGVWLFFGFFYLIIAPSIANLIVPTADGSTEAIIRNYTLQISLLRVSPNYLFMEAAAALLQPQMGIGILLELVGSSVKAQPLSLGQMQVWPNFTLLISVTLVCFAVSYVVFMKREIRSG
jgi:ABC-2 type transport system permease protein